MNFRERGIQPKVSGVLRSAHEEGARTLQALVFEASSSFGRIASGLWLIEGIQE